MKLERRRIQRTIATLARKSSRVLILTVASVLFYAISHYLFQPEMHKDNQVSSVSQKNATSEIIQTGIRNRTGDLTDGIDISVDLFFGDDVEELFRPGSPLASLPESITKDVVLTFVNTDYLDVFTVWLHYYKKHNHTRRILCLFAMSTESVPTFRTMRQVFLWNKNNITNGIGPTILLHTPIQQFKESQLWTFRVQMVRRIIDTFQNINVLMTDVDALWLNDPEPLYLGTNNHHSDVVSSTGKFPRQCGLAKSETKNFAACMGFIFLRNTPAVRYLLSIVESVLPDNEFDDQRAFNCALRQRYPHPVKQNLGDGSIALSYNESFLNVTLLPYNQVVRYCGEKTFHREKRKSIENQPQEVSVAHCVSVKAGEKKMRRFKGFGLIPDKLVSYGWEGESAS